jgi:pimeloyl-ACP methyl ester carboxylesterase
MDAERGSNFSPDFSGSGELSQALNHFPTTVHEYFNQMREAGMARTSLELAQIGTDAAEAYMAEKRLLWDMAKPDFFEEAEPLDDKSPNIVFLPGFLTWRGFGDNLPGGTPWPIKGTYQTSFRYFRESGCRVHPIFPDSGFNDASVEKSVEKTAEVVHRLSETSEGSISMVGHSLGGEEEYLFASRHPELAGKVKDFITGGSPLPVWLNSWIKGGLLALRNPKEIRLISDMIEFLSARESGDFRAKLKSFISERDCVIKGPSPSSVKKFSSGHSSMFFSAPNLSEIVQIVKG